MRARSDVDETMGLQGAAGALLNILMRGPVRLAPGFLRALCYRRLLRTGPRRLIGYAR
jgi:hypothetical protein